MQIVSNGENFVCNVETCFLGCVCVCVGGGGGGVAGGGGK